MNWASTRNTESNERNGEEMISETLKKYEKMIQESFEIFGDEMGFEINSTNIIAWRAAKLIDEETYHYLRKYNRIVYSDLPIK